MRAQLRLLPKRSQSLSSYLETRGPIHAEWARAIGQADCEGRTYERILFALLSTNTAFDATCEAFKLLRGSYWADAQELETLLRSVRVGGKSQTVAYPGSKARDIAAFTTRFRAHPGMFKFRGLASAWRAQHCIAGLGHMKLSFASALLAPEQADTVCLDRHMQRFLYGRERTPSLTSYHLAEQALRKVGERYGISAFVTQWAIWDWLRGREESHDILV